MMLNNTPHIEIGQLKSAYGLQGWLWIYSNTDPMTNVFAYQPWLIKSKAGVQTLTVHKWKTQGKGLVVSFVGIDDRNAADLLVGATIYVAKDAIPPAGEDEYYWSDLVGVTVFGKDNDAYVNFGVIKYMFETGAHDVMSVVATADSIDEQDRMIPWHKDIVLEVDMVNKKLIVDWQVDY